MVGPTGLHSQQRTRVGACPMIGPGGHVVQLLLHSHPHRDPCYSGGVTVTLHSKGMNPGERHEQSVQVIFSRSERRVYDVRGAVLARGN